MSIRTFFYSYEGLAVLIIISILISFSVIFLVFWYGDIIGHPRLGVEHLSDYDLRTISQSNSSQVKFVQITDTDLQNLPKLKQIIDMIKNHTYNNNGTVDQLGYNHIEMPKDELEVYQTWFEKKFEHEYDTKENTFYYFQYGGGNYLASFLFR